MPSTITGPVRLPDGTIPDHGRIIFQRREPRIASPIVLPGPVEAQIGTDATFSVSLQGDSTGAVYAVKVEYWPAPAFKPVSVDLPDVVIDGTDGPFTLAAVSSVPIPRTSDGLVIQQGESLNVGGRYLDVNNRPVSISDVTITSWLSQGEGRVTLAVTKLDAAAGTFEVTAGPTVTAPLLGRYEWIIRMSSAGRVVIQKENLTVEKVA